ncbi:MAG: SUMF1/EgtB/PvdO family nonheme iron enzyme [Candidatus Delongbacteria bacterium]|nr:SUMF1/EgtB/PvdO family nonheme iron enzyme [Candidatus Delongbacteria bacterium]
MIGKEEIYRYDKVKKEYILFKEIEKPVENNSHKGLIDMVFIESSIFGTKGKVVSADNYYIGKYEVTQSQYKSVMNFNPSQFRGDDLPVESVTLNDAIEFCNKLSEMEGLKKCYNRSECDLSANGYRLPTQDEWSGAVLGGGNKYSGSNDINEVAWYNKNSIRKTHSVGQKKPNEKGIYDMTGNVWEMCWDIWDDGDNSRKSRRNKKINRLMCGGGYSDGASNCRIGISSGFSSENKKKDIGFRVVRTADK